MLHYLKKIDPDPPTELEKPIGDASYKAIVAWWKDRPQPHEKVQLLSAFNKVRGRGDWMACDCRIHEGIVPLLVPMAVNGTTPVFARHGAQHGNECPFSADPISDQPLSIGQSNQFEAPELTPPSLMEIAPVGGNENSCLDFSEPTKMAKLLWWVAEASGWQTYPTPSKRASKVFINEAFESMSTFAPPWEVVFQSMEAITTGAALESLHRQSRKHGTTGVCWVVGDLIEHSHSEKVATWRHPTQQDATITTAVGSCITVDDASPTEAMGASVGLASVQLFGNDVSVTRVARQKSVDKNHKMLVNSHDERSIAFALIRFVQGKRSKGSDMVLHKPLYGWRQTGMLPSFVLEETSTGKVVFIEARTALKDAKKHQQAKIQKMEQWEDVFDISAQDLDGGLRDLEAYFP